MLNLQICTVIIMTKKKKNIKKKQKKKIMSFSRFELGTHGFVIHLQFHYAMEANANYREK